MIRNLWAGLKLALFLRANARDFRVSLWQLWGLIFLYLALQFGADFFAALPPKRFSLQSMSSALVFFGAMLLAASLVGMLFRRQPMTLALSVIALNGLLLPFILQLILSNNPHFSWLHGTRHYRHALMLFHLWDFTVFFRALLLISGTEALRQLAAALLLLASFAVPSHYIYPLPFWYHDYTKEDEAEDQRRPSLYPEDVLQGQDTLLNAQLAAIAPRRAGRNTYVVLFGGYADENVFLKEVTFGRKVLEEKYHAAGHVLTLVNNKASLTRTPMATVANLRNALTALRRKADLRQDLLLLYFTSHGSKEGDLSVEMQDIWLRQLDGKGLKALLNQSGFNWKAVIVSSCYSGMFIDPLKDDYTLIMTSARKDRTSFGCGNESTMTYFGDAFFAQALPKTTDLPGAFTLARDYIAKREEETGMEPHSEPQIFIGRRIAEYLQGKNPPLPQLYGPPAPVRPKFLDFKIWQ